MPGEVCIIRNEWMEVWTVQSEGHCPDYSVVTYELDEY